MPRMIRSLAIVLVLLAAAQAWAAGERDITIAQGIDAEFLDVQMTNNIVTVINTTSIYDTLLTRAKQLQLVPSLATSYKNASERDWVAQLRPCDSFLNWRHLSEPAVQ